MSFFSHFFHHWAAGQRENGQDAPFLRNYIHGIHVISTKGGFFNICPRHVFCSGKAILSQIKLVPLLFLVVI